MIQIGFAGRRNDPRCSLWLSPHQDDELLQYGAAIIDEIRNGYTVYVVLTTRGETDAVRTSSGLFRQLGYTPGVEEFSAARDREFLEGVRRLGANPILPTWAQREAGRLSVASRIVALVKATCPSGCELRAPALTDYHIDHIEAGKAALILAEEKFGRNVRLTLSAPYQQTNAPRGVVMQPWGIQGDVTMSHQWGYRTVDVPNGWWGIGYKSVPSRFNDLANNSRTYFHLTSERS